MNGQKWNSKVRGVAALIAAAAMVLLGLGASSADDEGTHARNEQPIVGFWQVTSTDAATKNVSYVWDVWHSDRTETQNDTGRTLDGNVCQGAWVPLGKRTYGLSHPYFIFKDPTYGQSHPELGWTEDNEGEFAGASCGLFERVTVDQSGNNYTGTGAVKCVLGADPFDPTAQMIFTGNSTITGKRVTVDVSQLPPA
jgi:hypothetical protein